MATEVISTIRSSGGDYTSLSAWEAGEQRNLVTADQIEVAECYDDWTSGLNDTFTVSGWTTDSTRYVKITVAAGHRHDGILKSGFWMYSSTSPVVTISQRYTVVEWITVEQTGAGTAISPNERDHKYNHVQAIGGTSGTSYGFNSFNSSATNIAKGCYASGATSGFRQGGAGTIELNNCVANGGTNGILRSSGTLNAYNCIVYAGTTAYNSVSGGSNNAAHNGSGTNPPGTSPYTSDVTSADFVDASGGDFHLDSGSGLIGAGANRYSTYTTDVDGDTWPSSGAWDIGFDYYVAAGGGTTTSNAPPGSIILTGSDSAGTRSLLSNASPGAFTVTSAESTGLYTPVSTTTSNADAGAYTLTGAASAGTRALLSQASPGSYTVTGLASAGTYTPVGSTVSNASPGAYNLTGSAASGVRNLLSNADAGSIIVTGFASSAIKAIVSNASPASYTITGADTAETWQHVSDASPGTWTITGYPSTGSVPSTGVTLSPEDIAAIADAVWLHPDAIAAHEQLDQILACCNG
jgi:hypothetical protein